MLNPILEQQLLEELNRLDSAQQRRILDFARELAESAKPQGVPAEDVIRAAAGLFSKKDVAEMMQRESW